MSNAAVNPTAGPLLDTPLDAVDKIMDINVKAALALVQVWCTVERAGIQPLQQPPPPPPPLRLQSSLSSCAARSKPQVTAPHMPRGGSILLVSSVTAYK